LLRSLERLDHNRLAGEKFHSKNFRFSGFQPFVARMADRQVRQVGEWASVCAPRFSTASFAYGSNPERSPGWSGRLAFDPMADAKRRRHRRT
jgi:hypothetical protein